MFQITDKIILLLILLIASVSDLRCRKVKNRYILLGIIIRPILLIIFNISMVELLHKLIYAFLITGFLLTIILMGEKIFKKQPMGGADIKLIFMCGLYLGEQLLYMVFIACVLTLIVAIGLKIKKRNLKIPFVPFLFISVILILLPAAIKGNYLTGQIIRGF